ncbi:Ig-like domain-containing protein [Cellulomonas alba]|uniref:Ig-like domain-containing protein n=1 Tax=Cellulomonas alba TaxID=3053467 RepID=A0ABT7SJX3_9CELL|nr:Ig-like domain-containing protein [Cellulomonas alba]MDM7855854.1 Ig-like domain-containing protein [Cellulomonas alba]
MTPRATAPNPSRRRLAVGAFTAAGLAAAALVGASPASAVDPVITGHVEAPGIASPFALVLAYVPGARGIDYVSDAPVGADGTFELDGVTPGTSYQILYTDLYGTYASGYYTSKHTLAPTVSGATLVAAGTTGLELDLAGAVAVKGSYVVPEDVSVDVDGPYLLEPSTGRPMGATIAETGNGPYTLGGATQGVKYDVVLSTYDVEDSLDGYFYAGPYRGLTLDHAHAVQVTGGSKGVDLYYVTATATAAPTVSGTAKVGSTLTTTAGTWDQDGVASYQWLRNGAVITGATASTYTLVGADYGTKVASRVTFTPSTAGHGPAQATSVASATVAAAAAPVLKTAPTISGTVASNAKLTASAGTWSLSGVTASYQWLRNGKAISGATAKTYAVSTVDVGKRLSVRITAHVLGHTSASATSAATKAVVRGKATVTETLSTTKAKAGATVKVTVRVKATGLASPVGKVTVKVGTKTVTKAVKSSAKGRVTLTLPRLSTKATYKVTATFTPSGTTAKVLKTSTSSVSKLRIV